MRRHIFVSGKVLNDVKNLYRTTKFSTAIAEKLTESEWLSVFVGVIQGRLLSHIVFDMFQEFIMREVQSILNKFMSNKY